MDSLLTAFSGIFGFVAQIFSMLLSNSINTLFNEAGTRTLFGSGSAIIWACTLTQFFFGKVLHPAIIVVGTLIGSCLLCQYTPGIGEWVAKLPILFTWALPIGIVFCAWKANNNV
jgi:hypothetical protein